MSSHKNYKPCLEVGDLLDIKYIPALGLVVGFNEEEQAYILRMTEKGEEVEVKRDLIEQSIVDGHIIRQKAHATN